MTTAWTTIPIAVAMEAKSWGWGWGSDGCGLPVEATYDIKDVMNPIHMTKLLILPQDIGDILNVACRAPITTVDFIMENCIPYGLDQCETVMPR